MHSFRKSRPGAPAGFFEVEAAGLAWLADAHTVRTPWVNAVGPGFIDLEFVTRSTPTAVAAVDFGRALSWLHDAGAPAFGAGPPGWVGDGFIGDAPLPLRPEPRWGVFYARHRIEPYLADAGLAGQDRSALETLCERLEGGDFDDPEPPARLHGDLWSGNVLFTATGVTLIDPAAHGGHRITDLAMLALFGSSQLKRILDAYAQTSPHLPEGWRRLIPLHQVHPLLVHATLFGAGYAERAAEAARRMLALS